MPVTLLVAVVDEEWTGCRTDYGETAGPAALGVDETAAYPYKGRGQCPYLARPPLAGHEDNSPNNN